MLRLLLPPVFFLVMVTNFSPFPFLCSFTSHFPVARSQVRPLKNQMMTPIPGSLYLLSLALSLNPLPLTSMHLKASLSPASLPHPGPYHSPICSRTGHPLTSLISFSTYYNKSINWCVVFFCFLFFFIIFVMEMVRRSQWLMPNITSFLKLYMICARRQPSNKLFIQVSELNSKTSSLNKSFSWVWSFQWIQLIQKSDGSIPLQTHWFHLTQLMLFELLNDVPQLT